MACPGISTRPRPGKPATPFTALDDVGPMQNSAAIVGSDWPPDGGSATPEAFTVLSKQGRNLPSHVFPDGQSALVLHALWGAVGWQNCSNGSEQLPPEQMPSPQSFGLVAAPARVHAPPGHALLETAPEQAAPAFEPPTHRCPPQMVAPTAVQSALSSQGVAAT
jgi:hypothetical protein